jgi:beta-phosphoglucomutase
LDGVIVSTDRYHYLGWKKLADEEGIYFDETTNERLRGISRMESLNIVLEQAKKSYTEDEKREMAERKNNYYRASLEALSPGDILPGVLNMIHELKSLGIKIAIGSSSKNTMTILEKIGLLNTFDVIVDGTMISESKPNPEVFLKAAKRLEVAPCDCLIVEDAYAGIQAAVDGGMKALGVGTASDDKRATYHLPDLQKAVVSELLR